MRYVNPYLVNKNQQGIAAIKSEIKILHDSESLRRKLIVAGPSDLTKHCYNRTHNNQLQETEVKLNK